MNTFNKGDLVEFGGLKWIVNDVGATGVLFNIPDNNSSMYLRWEHVKEANVKKVNPPVRVGDVFKWRSPVAMRWIGIVEKVSSDNVTLSIDFPIQVVFDNADRIHHNLK